jgi:tetratricopeptide (TPR) repeat protein
MSARARSWLGCAALAALVAAVYWPTLGNGYVSDDEVYIRGIRELGSLAGLRDIWLRIGATPQYYPLLHSVLWLEHRIWGLEPIGFHAMNAAVHAGVAMLAWRLLVRLAVPGAWLAAALFAVHPVHVETVAWASERKNVLSAAFALGAILAYLRFEDAAPGARRRAAYAVSLALYAAALLCKTVVVSVPAVLLVLRWWRTGALARRDAAPLVPFLAVGLPLALVTIWAERTVVGATGAAWEIGLLERVLIAGRAVCFYLGKLAWPHPLGFVYPRWTVEPRDLASWLYPAAVVALAAALWLARGRIGRGPLAALLLFVGVLFPALGFFDVYPFLFSFVADHYQYHASLAPIALAAAAVALGGARLEQAGPRGAAHAAVALALAGVGALALLAYRETWAYRDDATLIRRSAELQPASWAARYRLGVVLQHEGRHEAALVEMREALRLFPAHAPIRVGIADSLEPLGRLDEAAAELEAVLAAELADDDRLTVRIRLGYLRVTQRRYAEAAAQLRAAAALAPGSAEAHYALGLVLRELGDAAGAREALERATRLEPGAAKAREGLAIALLEAGDLAGAETELRARLALPPPSADVHDLLGVALWRRGERGAAIEQFQEALRLAPGHAGASGNLGRALAEDGGADAALSPGRAHPRAASTRSAGGSARDPRR